MKPKELSSDSTMQIILTAISVILALIFVLLFEAYVNQFFVASTIAVITFLTGILIYFSFKSGIAVLLSFLISPFILIGINELSFNPIKECYEIDRFSDLTYSKGHYRVGTEKHQINCNDKILEVAMSGQTHFGFGPGSAVVLKYGLLNFQKVFDKFYEH